MAQENTYSKAQGMNVRQAVNKARNFTIRMPYSNPMYFTRNGKYRVWHDAEDREFSHCYTQRWAETDRLSFQFSWENLHYLSVSPNFTVKFIVNGSVKRQATFSATHNQNITGSLYSEFVVRRRDEDGYVNGLYAFSMIISGITSGGTRIINIGDEFRIEIADMAGDVWKSNTMLCTDSLEGTKLIHYTQYCGLNQCAFDTFWGWMPYGYDLRMEACYTELGSNSDMTLFDTYTGGKVMITSIPKESVVLNIGDNHMRIPREFFRLLNVVFCCDDKTIDGFDVEVSEGTFDIDRVTGISNDKYTVTVVLRDNRHSYLSVTENEILEIQVIEGFGDNTGEIKVLSSKSWYLDFDSVKNDIEFDRVSGSGNGDKVMVRMSANTSGEDITYTVAVKSMDGRTLKTLDIENRSVNPNGLGHMAIGDTFRIS